MFNSFFRTWMIVVVAIGLSLLWLGFITWRLIGLLRINVRTKGRQVAEIINDRVLVNSQGERIALLGTFHPDANTCYVLVADYFGMAKYSFARLLARYQKQPSVILLSFGERFADVKDTINNCVDLLWAVHRRYPTMSLGLVLEGHSCGLATMIAKRCDLVKNIIYCNPITNHQAVRFYGRQRWLPLLAFLFSWKIKVRWVIDYRRLFDEVPPARVLHRRSNRYFVLTILQLKLVNRYFAKTIRRIKCHQTIVQAKGDPFLNLKKLKNISNNVKCHLILLASNNHFNLNFDLWKMS